jgi:hypothetical protein
LFLGNLHKGKSFLLSATWRSQKYQNSEREHDHGEKADQEYPEAWNSWLSTWSFNIIHTGLLTLKHYPQDNHGASVISGIKPEYWDFSCQKQQSQIVFQFYEIRSEMD